MAADSQSSIFERAIKSLTNTNPTDQGPDLALDALIAKNPFGPIPGKTTQVGDLSVTRRGNIYIDALAWATERDPFRNAGEKGKTVITFAFGNASWYALTPSDDTLGGIRSIGWNAKHGPQGPVTLMNGDTVSFGNVTGEQAGVLLAQKLWENVTNIQFKMIAPARVLDADLKYIITDNANMKAYWKGGADWEYPFSEMPSDEGTPQQKGFTVLNKDYENYKNNNLGAGSLGLYDTVHEIGHQLGLDHPWKEETGAPYLPGATAWDDMGDYRLNQGIYTVMSYSYGWDKSYRPQDEGAPPPNFGSAIGPMAFDIAAIQAVYGANMNYRTGNDIYRLPTGNAAGIGWMCLWDAGGTDEIVAGAGAGDCVIDLRAATLDSKDGSGAGGYVSWVKGVMGGFTIAHGVKIENARGGAGDDTINGNEFANELRGSGGDDLLNGFAGNDTLYGGTGTDWINAGTGADILYGEAGDDLLFEEAGDDYLDGGKGGDLLVGGSGADFMIGDEGRDVFAFASLQDFTAMSSSACDVIADFKRGEDIVDLSGVAKELGGAFRFSAAQNFSGRFGELIFQQRNGAGYLLGDLNGDSNADFRIQLNGVTSFAATDLRLA